MSETAIVRVLPPAVVTAVHALAPITLNAPLGSPGLWQGEGPPGTIVGASIGDGYLDTLTGTLYRLDPGI